VRARPGDVIRPSPSMIVALAGLATAIGGQASIGKDQVTSRSVKDDSLLLADFKPSQRGLVTGPTGSPGPSGAPGLSARGQIFLRTAQSSVATSPACIDPCGPTPPPDASHNTATVACLPGEVAVHGGGVTLDPVVMDIAASYPNADGLGWTAIVENNDITRPHTFTVYVLCVRGTSAPA
jgi:hypothetical protein